MKRILLALAILTITVSQAQFKVKVNGKPVAENATFKIEDIKSFDVAFDKPKTLKYYGMGRAILGVALLSPKNELVEEYVIKKNGTNSIESFLSDLNVYYNVIPNANGEKSFTPRVLSYNFPEMLSKDDSEMVKVEIQLVFFEKIGYEKYGEAIPLLKKFVFMIDNKTNATAVKAKREESQAKYAAEKAEREKEDRATAAKAKQQEDAANAASAAREAASKAEGETKKKKKGLLNSVLNKL